jgi:hypothetical protein
MPITFFSRARGGADRAFDANVLSWRDAVVANGGSVSLARLIVVDQFVFSEKASGNWTLTDDYLGLWAENAPQALTSLKQRRLASAVNSPVFTADRQYAFDGSTSYIDTGFVPSTHALSMTADSLHAEVYERSNLSGSTTSMGTNSGSARQIRILTRNGSGATGYANCNPATFTLPSNSSLGLTQIGRSGSALTDAYGAKNGGAMTRTADPSGIGPSLPAHSLYIGGFNNQGTFANWRACTVGFAAWGAALAGGQCLARYNAVQAWATSVGAQV